MRPDLLERIFKLPVSQLGRRFVLAEVLGKPVSLRIVRTRCPAPEPPKAPPAPAKDG